MPAAWRRTDALREKTSAHRADVLVPDERPRVVGKVHPACAQAIGVIRDHFPEPTTEPPRWQGSCQSLGDGEGIRDAAS